MARNYDGESSSSVRDEMLQQQQQQDMIYKKIELGVIIGAFAIAGLSVVLNIGKCVSYTGKANEYNATRIESEATLADLNAKLQDPAAQNYEYKDPTVGNMMDIGSAMALAQNQLILANQLYNNYGNIPGATPSNDDAATMESESEADHGQAPALTGGAVTLDPTDMAPTQSEAETPATESVESSEGVAIEPDSGSGYEYTPITDFNTNPVTEQNTVSNNSIDQTAIQNVTGNDLARLITEFKETYYATPVTNVENNDTTWSWYGHWEFSGTYDYSVNEIPDMKAVWTCYDVADTTHLRPIAFVKANYSQSTKKFTNMEAVYTQAYVKKSESQASKWGNAADATTNGSSQTGAGGASLPPDGTTPNGTGSENEFRPNIIEDESTTDNGVKITPETTAPTTTPSGGSNSGTMPGNNTPASNPPGQAPWSSGTGAGTTVPSGSGNWTPSGGESGTANPDGTWTPSGSTGTTSQTPGTVNPSGSWTPSN